MGFSVRRIVVWRGEVPDVPGALEAVLDKLARAGTEPRVVMGYAYPGAGKKAIIEVCPVTNRKSISAARAAGLSPQATPTLSVQATNNTGLSHRITRAIARAGISIRFLVTQGSGSGYSSILGFKTEAEAARAAILIRRVLRAN